VFLGVRSCDKRVTWADYWFSSVSRWWIVATTKRAFTCSVPVNVVVSINLDIIYPSSGRTSCSSIRRYTNLDPVVAATEREGKRERQRDRETERERSWEGGRDSEKFFDNQKVTEVRSASTESARAREKA